MTAYYSEIDPYAAEWLHRLMIEGMIAPGYVDTRSIEDVTPNDLAGYTQCHFFAGIGVWSYALRLAGWPDDRPVWTGSCPCQPFSAAGKGGGFADERHLWPAWFHLITQCQPATLFGEQVASPAGLGWFDIVSADLEASNYAVGAVDTCAAGVGAPHIRQRLYWMAHDHTAGRLQQWGTGLRAVSDASQRHDVDGRGADVRSADADERTGGQGGANARGWHQGGATQSRAGLGGSELLGDNNNNAGLEGRGLSAGKRAGERTAWTPSDVVWCRDGKWRPVEPGTFPLAHGAPARVGRLRAYGNAIVAPLAAEFIEAYLGV